MYRAYLGLEKQHKNKYQSKTFFLIQINMGKLLILISRNQDIVSFHFREKKEDLISSFNCSAIGLRFDNSSKSKVERPSYRLQVTSVSIQIRLEKCVDIDVHRKRGITFFFGDFSNTVCTSQVIRQSTVAFIFSQEFDCRLDRYW